MTNCLIVRHELLVPSSILNTIVMRASWLCSCVTYDLKFQMMHWWNGSDIYVFPSEWHHQDHDHEETFLITNSKEPEIVDNQIFNGNCSRLSKPMNIFTCMLISSFKISHTLFSVFDCNFVAIRNTPDGGLMVDCTLPEEKKKNLKCCNSFCVPVYYVFSMENDITFIDQLEMAGYLAYYFFKFIKL